MRSVALRCRIWWSAISPSLLVPPRADEDDPPVLKMLRGAAKGVDPEEYRSHLVRKYR